MILNVDITGFCIFVTRNDRGGRVDVLIPKADLPIPALVNIKPHVPLLKVAGQEIDLTGYDLTFDHGGPAPLVIMGPDRKLEHAIAVNRPAPGRLDRTPSPTNATSYAWLADLDETIGGGTIRNGLLDDIPAPANVLARIRLEEGSLESQSLVEDALKQTIKYRYKRGPDDMETAFAGTIRWTLDRPGPITLRLDPNSSKPHLNPIVIRDQAAPVDLVIENLPVPADRGLPMPNIDWEAYAEYVNGASVASSFPTVVPNAGTVPTTAPRSTPANRRGRNIRATAVEAAGGSVRIQSYGTSPCPPAGGSYP